MTDKIELKPCPFCGGKAYFLHGRKNECITCEECGHRFYSLEIGEDAQKELWKQWNSRPIEDHLIHQIDLLEQEVKTLRDALTFYAKGEHLGLEDWQTEQVLKDDEVFAESYCETGKVAREALKGNNAGTTIVYFWRDITRGGDGKDYD